MLPKPASLRCGDGTRRRGVAAPAAALVLALGGGVAAQEPRKGAAYAPPEPPVLRWEVVLGGAGGFGVSSGDMDAAFTDAGYLPASSGDFLSATFYPAVRFRLGDHAALGVSYSSTRLGSTTATAPGATVTIQRSSEDVALVAFWRPIPGLRLGAGPAWYRLTATPSGGPDLAVSKLGWIAEAGFAGPDPGRVYGDLGVQYRGTGSADFGTYQPPARGLRAPAPVSLDGISCGHWALVVGVGFRF